MHEYSHALVGKVTHGSHYGDGIEFDDIRRQHDCYLRLLRELNVEVVEVDLQGTLHEKVLLEDLAIICHGIALLPKSGSTIEAHNVSIHTVFVLFYKIYNCFYLLLSWLKSRC